MIGVGFFYWFWKFVFGNISMWVCRVMILGRCNLLLGCVIVWVCCLMKLIVYKYYFRIKKYY